MKRKLGTYIESSNTLRKPPAVACVSTPFPSQGGVYHPLIKWEGQTDRKTWSRRRRRLHIYNCSSQHSSVAESDYGLLCALFVVKGRGCKTTPLNLLSDVIKWLKTRENAVVWDGRALFFKISPNGRGFPNGFTIKTFHEAPIWFCLANRLFTSRKHPFCRWKTWPLEIKIALI